MDRADAWYLLMEYDAYLCDCRRRFKAIIKNARKFPIPSKQRAACLTNANHEVRMALYYRKRINSILRRLGN